MTIVHTDLPIIISGDTIGFLDPQEKVWCDGGWSYELSDIWKRKKDYWDTIVPFINKQGFTCNMTMYPGTLFRFPLRNEVSNISANVYNVINLCDLLIKFKEEAKLLLLFLQSVNTIEIILDKTTCFSIMITEEKQIHDKDAFIQDVHTHWKLNAPVSLVMMLNITILLNKHLQSKHSWLISYYLGCLDDDNLHRAEKLNVIPYVGAAMEVPVNNAAEMEVPEDNAMEIHLDGTMTARNSRIFCFLPMPVELTCPLPVHINGTFATSDDRRSLKWRSAQNPSEEDEARWNEIIVSGLLPHCYALLIKEACQRLIHSDVVYRMWPNVTNVLNSEHWKPVLEPLFKILCTQSIFWTAKSGKWISLMNAILTPKVDSSPPGWEIVCDVIANSNEMLVEVPQNVLEYCLKFKTHVQMSQLTPSLITKLLKQYPLTYTQRPHDEKLALLMYCLSNSRSIINVVGLMLLPLANGKYAKFYAAQECKEQKFLCTDRYPLELFPEKCQHQLVNITEADKHIVFRELAKSGITNLYLLDDKITSVLLSKNISVNDTSSVSQWLPLFWAWSQTHHLNHFLGQQLIPLSYPPNCVDKLSSSKDSKTIYLEDDCDEDLLMSLRHFSISYVKCCDYPYLKHSELANYIHKFSPNGILNALQNVSLYPKTMDLNKAYIFQQFLTSIISPTSGQIKVLLSLPIFITTSNKVMSVELAQLSSWKRKVVMMTSDEFDTSCLPTNLVVLKSKNSRSLLEKFAKDCIHFPDINDMIKACYSL